MRLHVLLALAALALPAHAQAPASATPSKSAPVVAITGGTVMVGDGTSIPGATVLVTGDRITAVGTSVVVPAGARVIEARGKIVTPGLVDGGNHLGATEIELVDETNEFALGDPDAIHAAFRVADALDPSSALIPVVRMEGVTSAVSEPEGGLIRGQSAWIRLRGTRVDEMVLLSPAGMHVNLGEASRGPGGGRGGAIEKLREVFEDARLLRGKPAAFEENRLRSLAASRLDLAALEAVLDRKIPLVARVHRAADIRAALAFAREQNVRLVIEGGAEAWRVAAELAAAKVPVLLQPSFNLPSSFESLGARSDSAAILDAAGVTVAILSGETHNARVLRQEAGNAVAWGLPREKALPAVTSAPAAIYGVGDRVGRLAPGLLADVVVWSGDPLELTTRAELVLIGGAEIPLRSRQTELFERYRTLPPKR